MIGRTRVIATEEHVVTPGVIAAWKRLEPEWRDAGFHDTVEGPVAAGLLDLREERIAAMDARGIDLAVLSLTTPGVQNFRRAYPDSAVAHPHPFRRINAPGACLGEDISRPSSSSASDLPHHVRLTLKLPGGFRDRREDDGMAKFGSETAGS